MDGGCDIGHHLGEIFGAVSGRQPHGEARSEVVGKASHQLQAAAAQRVVHLEIITPVGIPAGIVNACLELVPGPGMGIPYRGDGHERVGSGKAEKVHTGIGTVAKGSGPKAVHFGLVLVFFQHGRLVIALVHIGRIPLLVLFIHQPAGIADTGIQRPHRQGRIQHRFRPVKVLLLEEFIGKGIGNACIGTLKVVIGREIGQISAEHINGQIVLPSFGQHVGGFDGKGKVVGIGLNAPYGIRERVFRRPQRIAQSPIIRGIYGQNKVCQGLQPGKGTFFQALLDIGINGFLDGTAQHLDGQRIRGVIIGSLERQDGRFRFPLLDKQRSIVHGNLILRIRLQTFLEHGDGFVRQVGLPVTYGQTTDGYGLEVRIYGVVIQPFQERDSGGITLFRHGITGLREPYAAA